MTGHEQGQSAVASDPGARPDGLEGHWLWRRGTTVAGPGTTDLASGSQGWELVPESPSPSHLCCSSQYRKPSNHGLPWLRCVTEVRYSELKPRAACPKGPEPKRPAPAAGQGSWRPSLETIRCFALVDAAGPLVCWPAIRHAADGGRWSLGKETCARNRQLQSAEAKEAAEPAEREEAVVVAVVEWRWRWRRMRRCV